MKTNMNKLVNKLWEMEIKNGSAVSGIIFYVSNEVKNIHLFDLVISRGLSGYMDITYI